MCMYRTCACTYMHMHMFMLHVRLASAPANSARAGTFTVSQDTARSARAVR